MLGIIRLVTPGWVSWLNKSYLFLTTAVIFVRGILEIILIKLYDDNC